MYASVEQKQKYLREQILQSYDPQEFVSFVCKDLHVQQLDVQNWDMKTIESIVLKFKQYKYYQGDAQKQPVRSQPQIRQKIVYEENMPAYDYQFQQTCDCIQVDALVENLEVFVPNFEVKQTEGLFFSIGSRREVWFTIKTNYNKQSTKRLMEDFDWLSTTVSRIFPLQAIPELLEVTKQNENNFVKRRKELEQYLQILATRDQLKRSNIFLDFLTIPPQKMQKLKKNCDSQNFARGIQTIKNSKGQVTFQFTNKLRNFALNSQSYLRKVKVIHEKLQESMQRVNESLQVASQQVNKIVDYFAQLHEIYNDLTNKSPVYKVNEYNEILININNFFHLISDNLSTGSKIIKNNLSDYFKLSQNYDKSMGKLYKNVMETEKDYLWSKNNLLRKKERIYPDISKWDVEEKRLEGRKITKEMAFDMMLPKETAIEAEQRQWLGYLYFSYKNQFDRYIAFEVRRYVQNYCTFASEVLLSNRNYVQEVTKFIEESRKINI